MQINFVEIDCKQSLYGQLRGLAHIEARLERGEISPLPLVCSCFYELGCFARPLDYPERDRLQSIVEKKSSPTCLF